MPRRPSSRIEPEDLIRLRVPRQARLSPDGGWVVFVEERPHLAGNRTDRNLVLLDARTGARRPLTSGEHCDRDPAWMPDGRAVVFVSERGGQDDLCCVRLDGGAPERLAQLAGDVRAPRVSADGRCIAFLFTARAAQGGRREDRAGQIPGRETQLRRVTRLGFKRDGMGLRDGAFTHLWSIQLRTRRLRALVSGEFDAGQHAWSPDGRRLAFVSNRGPRAELSLHHRDIWVVTAHGGRLRRLAAAPGPKQAPAWSPDGRAIAYIGHAAHSGPVDNLHVWALDLRRGRSRDLMSGSDLTCGEGLQAHPEDEPEAPVWSADGERLFFLAHHEGETNVWEVDAAGGVPRQRSFGRQAIAELSQSHDGRSWAFVRSTPSNPGEIWLAGVPAGAAATRQQAGLRRDSRAGTAVARGADPRSLAMARHSARVRAGGAALEAAGARGELGLRVAGAAVRRLTRSDEAGLRGGLCIEPTEFRLPRAGGKPLHGWMLRGAGRGRGPALLVLQGGPHAMHGWRFSPELQLLAARGHHVFCANLRGSAGYGRDFMRAVVGKWGTRDYEDLMRVVDLIESQPFVDRARIGIAGFGYGGYLASWAIGHTRRFRCAVSVRGMSNLLSLFGTGDRGWDLVHEFEGQRPWESLDRYWRVSPLAFVHEMRTPLLLLHREDDLRCPVSQSEELFTALRVLRRDVEMVRFTGACHEGSRRGRPQSRLEEMRCILDWLARKL